MRFSCLGTISKGRQQFRRPRRDRYLPWLECLETRTLLSFSLPTDFAAGASPFAVIAADFNGDGKLDLATANAADNSVSILLGNDDGTFRGPMNFAVGTRPQA